MCDPREYPWDDEDVDGVQTQTGSTLFGDGGFFGDEDLDEEDDDEDDDNRFGGILMQLAKALTKKKGSFVDLDDFDGVLITGTLGPDGEFEIDQVIAADDTEKQAIADQLFEQQVGPVAKDVNVKVTSVDDKATIITYIDGDGQTIDRLVIGDDNFEWARENPQTDAVPVWGTGPTEVDDPDRWINYLTPNEAADIWSRPGATGYKDDAMKNRLDLIDPEFLSAMGAVLTKGAVKYGDHNWRGGMPFARLYGALQRHLNAFWAGELIDPDSQMEHLAHAACELMFLLWMSRHRPDLDDRWVDDGE